MVPRFVIVLSILLSNLSSSLAKGNSKCEPITINFCENLGYNETIFPNLLQHRNQDEAELEILQFQPLVQIQCSEYIQFFLCSVYAPVCTVLETPLPPCRSLCEEVRSKCINSILTFGFDWPESLRCSRYPEFGGETLCVGENTTRQIATSTPRPGIYPDESLTTTRLNGSFATNPVGPVTVPPYFTQPHPDTKFYKCPRKQWKKDDMHYSFMGITECTAPCRSIYFQSKERDFARDWVFGLAAACVISTLFAISTFFVDMRRFRYPERPIIFLSVCYLGISIIYIMGYASGDNIACHKIKYNHKTDENYVRNQGDENKYCMITSMFLYFFTMTSATWWVALTITWFFATTIRCGRRTMEASSLYFHAAACAFPAAKTIAVLALNEVDGDELTGVCFVGGLNLHALRWFVLTPLFVYLVLGTFFLLAGCISLRRIRPPSSYDRSLPREKLKKIMTRIGVFSIFYTLPAIIVIGLLLYEHTHRSMWDKSWKEEWYRQNWLMHNNLPNNVDNILGSNRPNLSLYTIKYFMLLIIGIISGWWVLLTRKTIITWKRFYYHNILRRHLPSRVSQDISLSHVESSV